MPTGMTGPPPAGTAVPAGGGEADFMPSAIGTTLDQAAISAQVRRQNRCGYAPANTLVALLPVPCLQKGALKYLSSVKPLRSPRKFSDGGGLYLLVAPIGGWYWRYNYRFNGKQKMLALGIYPYVSLAKARARHQAARHQLAGGIDPSTTKRELRSRPAGIASDAAG